MGQCGMYYQAARPSLLQRAHLHATMYMCMYTTRLAGTRGAHWDLIEVHLVHKLVAHRGQVAYLAHQVLRQGGSSNQSHQKKVGSSRAFTGTLMSICCRRLRLVVVWWWRVSLPLPVLHGWRSCRAAHSITCDSILCTEVAFSCSPLPCTQHRGLVSHSSVAARLAAPALSTWTPTHTASPVRQRRTQVSIPALCWSESPAAREGSGQWAADSPRPSCKITADLRRHPTLPPAAAFAHQFVVVLACNYIICPPLRRASAQALAHGRACFRAGAI